jgi:putative ATP-dependent endonuclease of OLD family
MYLSNLKLWNFRKFGSDSNPLDLKKPDLEVPFTKGLNVLIGENDSGKTAIIDAIKLVLNTHSSEWVRRELDDFYKNSTRFRIECRFDGFSDDEAKNFTEWLGMKVEGENALPYLRVILDATKQDERIIGDIRAGVDDEGYLLHAEARNYLKTTYLKPLRDAKYELMPRKGSRLSQILTGHEAFKDKDEGHSLIKAFEEFKTKVDNYFKADDETKVSSNESGAIEETTVNQGKSLKKQLDVYLEKFFGQKMNSSLLSSDKKKLKDILEILKLALEEENLGLGSHNLLFIATELLNLDRSNWYGLRLGLIEELEAHLHPQAQLKVIAFLQELSEKKDSEKKDSEEGSEEEATDKDTAKNNKNVQFILTTHSPKLGSKVKLENLIICDNGKAFPMREGDTKLNPNNRKFLERFLDVTKANLFFAKGVIFVEGWAEELILPALAKTIGYDLTKNGVSIVNVASTAFLHYSRIFQRTKRDHEENIKIMDIPVSIITDLDVKPFKNDNSLKTEEELKSETEKATKDKKDDFDGQKVKTFVSPLWTLEYCIAHSSILRKIFYKSFLLAFKDIKNYQQPEKIKTIDTAIENIDSLFNSWNDADTEIALKIYKQILGEEIILDLCKKEVSKPLIAQIFAEELERSTLSKTDLEGDAKSQYLIKAIKYATGNDTSN